MATKRVYSYWLLENIPRFEKIYSACDLLMCILCAVNAADGVGSDGQTLHVCCSWCRLRLTNTACVVCAAAGAGSDRQILHVLSVLQLMKAPTDKHRFSLNATRGVWAAAGEGSDRQTLYVPSVLQLVKDLTDQHYSCRLCCSRCRF